MAYRTLSLVAAVALLAGCGPTGTPAPSSEPSTPAAPGGHSVFYSVTGPVDTAKVIYTVPNQAPVTEDTARLPWKKEFSTSGGRILSVSGGTSAQARDLECQIWVDGSMKVTHRGIVAFCTTTVEDEAVEPSDAAPSDDSIPGDGTFAVGDEVKPGTYRSDGPVAGSCYWARLRSLAAGPDDIIANGNSEGPVTVKVLKSDEGFETHGCQDWERVKG